MYQHHTFLVFCCIKSIKNYNNLYFAGEHTHDKYGGYIQGAYYSGVDVANEIINKIKK